MTQRPPITRFLCTALLTFLTGCTYNPFLHSDDTADTNHDAAVGTFIGAGVGAGSAAIFHAPKAVIGLAGLIGGGVGYYVTTLQHAAGPIISSGGVMYQLGDYGTIEVPTDRLFDANSAEFLSGTTPILNSIAAVLSHFPDSNIMISCSTSGSGPRKYENKLSEERARQVAAYLWSKGISVFRSPTDHPMEMRRLIYVGYGNYFPIANDLHINSIRANSRIQITIFPAKETIHDKRYKVFNNIGALNEPEPGTEEGEPVDYNQLFPPGEPPGTAYKEHALLEEGEVPPNRSTVSPYRTSHTQGYASNHNIGRYRSSIPTDVSEPTVSTRPAGWVGYKGER